MIEHDGSDLVGGYVLDALETEERAAFEAHLAGCSACRAEVAELREVVAVLPLSVEAVEPAPALKSRLLAAVQGVDPLPAEWNRPAPQPVKGVNGKSSPSPTGLRLVQPRGGRSLRRPTRWESILGIAAAVLIAGLGVWNIQLHNQNGNQQNSTQAAVVDAIAHGAAVSSIPATAASPGASAVMVQPRGGNLAYFLVRGLPASRAGRVYEIWLMRNQVPRGVAVFTYPGTGTGIVTLPTSTSGWQLAAVTDERGPGGARRPTTKPLLLGKLA